MVQRPPPLALVLVTLACGLEPYDSGDEHITGVGSTSTGDIATPTVTGVSLATHVPSDMTTGPAKDVGPDDWDLPPYCGALDIVLTVEQSPTTRVEVAYHLAYELPQAIEERLPGWSLHYLQVPGTSPAYTPKCETSCLEEGFCPAVPDFPCEKVEPCAWPTGAGMLWRSFDEKCIPGPRRWVDANEDDVGAVIHCLWKGGLNAGDFYGALAPTLGAVSKELTEPGGCNAGFLRDDAWLLPILLSHGHPGPGEPEDWAAQLAAAKGGDMTAVVPVAILDPQTDPGNPPGCQEGPGDYTYGYHELVELFPMGVIGDLCQPYTPPILEAIDHIAEVCKVSEIPD